MTVYFIVSTKEYIKLENKQLDCGLLKTRAHGEHQMVSKMILGFIFLFTVLGLSTRIRAEQAEVKSSQTPRVFSSQTRKLIKKIQTGSSPLRDYWKNRHVCSFATNIPPNLMVILEREGRPEGNCQSSHSIVI